MSAEAKAKKLAGQLERAREAEKEAAEKQKEKVREEQISQPQGQLKRQAPTCRRCHNRQVGVCRKKNAKTGKIWNCEERGEPACTSYARCKYRKGHEKQANAADRIAKLEKKSRAAEAAAEAEVRVFSVLALIVCYQRELSRKHAVPAIESFEEEFEETLK
jgi:hypothetical protein